jgi:hypothetical protein
MRLFTAAGAWKALVHETHALIVHIAACLDTARVARERLTQQPG